MQWAGKRHAQFSELQKYFIRYHRHKGFYIMNVPSAITWFVNFVIKQAPEKFRERVKLISSSDLLDIVDKENLPAEYGGKIPADELAGE